MASASNFCVCVCVCVCVCAHGRTRACECTRVCLKLWVFSWTWNEEAQFNLKTTNTHTQTTYVMITPLMASHILISRQIRVLLSPWRMILVWQHGQPPHPPPLLLVIKYLKFSCCLINIFSYCEVPQTKALKIQGHSPFPGQAGQNTAVQDPPCYGQEFSFSNFCLPGPFHFIFSQSSSTQTPGDLDQEQ